MALPLRTSTSAGAGATGGRPLRSGGSTGCAATATVARAAGALVGTVAPATASSVLVPRPSSTTMATAARAISATATAPHLTILIRRCGKGTEIGKRFLPSAVTLEGAGAA